MSERWAGKIKGAISGVTTTVKSKASEVKSDIGKKHTTKDASFGEVLKQFDEQKKLIDALAADVTGFIGGADAVIQSQKSLTENLLKLAPEGSTMNALCRAQLDCCDKMVKAKGSYLDQQLNQTFTTPVNLYLGQYREVTDRVRERNRRETEMDKLITQRDKFKEKGDARLAATETKLVSATAAYEDLNKELIEDIPKLLEDSMNFFQPLILLLILNQAKFWQSMSEQAVALAQRVDSNMATVPQIVPVLTPKNQSAMNKKYVQAANPWASTVAPPQQQQAFGLAPASPGQVHSGNPFAQPSLSAQATVGYGAPAPTPGYGHSPAPVHAGPGPVPLPPRPAPPTPAAPQHPQVKGLWDFVGQDSSELTFRAGEVFSVLEQNGDWWVGEKGGVRGMFPANYVELIR
eukprot:TRINITY_DN1756_c0_g3_i1.p1 TRINITY_DN1756_c0_g3~~TRINITY_DN1756_c0_g3_i1.p1  ORF type:complete len:405 (+),score=135.70 TRINITY_DN1756_c0_g3_i1:647-1861(+)